MSAPKITSAVLHADRRIGATTRRRVAAVPGGPEAARLVADATAPAYHVLVGALIVLPGSRMTGLRALVAGAMAATIARVLRDGLARERPGARGDGGFPSRHAATATAIATVVARDTPLLGAITALAGLAGVTARVASADHDPLDIVAGVGLGVAVGRIMQRRRPRRS